jgi:hypothetical protein
VDTRPYAVSREVTLHGLPAHAYRLADDPVDEATLSSQLAARGICASPAALSEAVVQIVAAGLALRRSSRLLSLAIPEPGPRPLPSLPGRDAAEEAFRRYLSGITGNARTGASHWNRSIAF